MLYYGVVQAKHPTSHGMRRGSHEAECGKDELEAVCLLAAVEGQTPMQLSTVCTAIGTHKKPKISIGRKA